MDRTNLYLFYVAGGNERATILRAPKVVFGQTRLEVTHGVSHKGKGPGQRGVGDAKLLTQSQ